MRYYVNGVKVPFETFKEIVDSNFLITKVEDFLNDSDLIKYGVAYFRGFETAKGDKNITTKKFDILIIKN